ncbi:hypothetical protein ACJMK2_044570 [Sinanodonta woodiana]|uniref:Uncharacterized protein n=1 Tax=Sinanodonta woodiana TaxID=1069815 RepID=A0ABD3W122_SINWO
MATMLVFLLAAVLVVVQCGSVIRKASSPDPDHCHIIIWGKSGTPVEGRADPSCHNGSIYWEYPQGEIKVHFTNMAGHSSSFSVCLSNARQTDIVNIYDYTTGMRHIMNLGESDVCSATSQNGEVILLFVGPTTVEHYLAFIDYYLK